MMLRLLELRKARGYTQKVLAEALSTTQQSIDQYEKGRFEPDIQMLTNMANFFDVSLDYLLGRSESAIAYSELILHLNRDEAHLIEIYRNLPTEVQQNVNGMFSYMSLQQPEN